MLKVSKISWLVLIGYIALAIFTFITLRYLTFARSLFSTTEFLLQFNVVWFGILIVVYGLYALLQNYRRINRLGLNESLDTQFLIVLTFIFMTIYGIMQFYLYSNTNLSSDLSDAIRSTAQVIFYGAFVAALMSIVLPKILNWWNKRSGA